MGAYNVRTNPPRLFYFLIPALLAIAAIVAVQPFDAASGEATASATYSHDVLNLSLPYSARLAGRR